MPLPRPDFEGGVHGECRSREERQPKRRPDGKIVRRPYPRPDGSTGWAAVMIKVIVIDWVWDARQREWLSEDAWRVRYPSPNAGRVVVSKHDFGPIARLRRQLAERKRRENLASSRKRRKNGGK